jgi:hypothetical protein
MSCSAVAARTPGLFGGRRKAMRTRRLVVAIGGGALVLLVLCCATGVILVRGHVFGRLYNEIVLDNYDHFLPCEKLPTSDEVDRVVEQHQDTVEAVEEVNPGFVWVEVDDFSCPGRADIVIYYASHRDRLAIEEILGGRTFYGVPCRFRNV